ncbi:MAG TPA: TlpA disulfide reductase family protein [Polyangia bacterium]|jgi:cytochrome c biogenesis protein CcmG/thiol:disulfide interchange protein DsbE
MTAAAAGGAGGAAADPRARARRRAVIAVAVLLALFALNGVWIARSVRGLRPPGGAAVGAPAPTFRGATLAGGQLDLAALRGQVVLLDFWATWCAPCIAEVPTLVRVGDTLGPRGLVIVGVNIEGPSAKAAVADFVAEGGIKFPIVLDDGPIASLYRVKELPHAVVIGRDGTIRRVLLGATPQDELTRVLEEALK